MATIPKSVPAKFRDKIAEWDDDRNEGGSIIVTLKGLRLDGPGTGDGSKTLHVFGEDTVADIVQTLRSAHPCHCQMCVTVVQSPVP